MPNIQTKQLGNISLPKKEGEFNFIKLFTSPITKNNLLLTTYKDREFFLEIKKRSKNYLIKADKLTMPPIHIIHQALDTFAKAFELQIEQSNLGYKTNRVKDFTYLKNIKYFFEEFKTDKEIQVEIGFGSGRHLLHQTLSNPNIQYIGIEIHKYSIEQVLKQIKLQNITNLLIIDYDARTFLEFLPSNSVGKIFVHFPVPWDKKPNRRVINKNLISESKRVLKVDGTLELRTDSENYYEYSYNLFISEPKTSLKINKNHDLNVSSKYEDRWKKQDKNIYDITMKNSINSPQKESSELIDFQTNLNPTQISKNFKNETIKQNDYFIHLENIYQYFDDDIIIKVSFGSHQNHEHKYIKIDKTITKFISQKVLPTKSNIKSFELLQKKLKNS